VAARPEFLEHPAEAAGLRGRRVALLVRAPAPHAVDLLGRVDQEEEQGEGPGDRGRNFDG
jgi:hypothetical protein